MFVLSLFVACSQSDAGDTTADSGTASVPVAAIGVGELVITEIMPNPEAVDGDFGEYLEIVSLAANELDLGGVTIVDSDGDGFTLPAPFPIAPGQRLIFAPSADSGQNGGLVVDFAYDVDAFKLGNEGDTVVVSAGSTIVDSVVYDEVTWGLVEGYSLQLAPGATDAASNDALENWCNSTSTFGAGDYGTPGAENHPC